MCTYLCLAVLRQNGLRCRILMTMLCCVSCYATRKFFSPSPRNLRGLAFKGTPRNSRRCFSSLGRFHLHTSQKFQVIEAMLNYRHAVRPIGPIRSRVAALEFSRPQCYVLTRSLSSPLSSARRIAAATAMHNKHAEHVGAEDTDNNSPKLSDLVHNSLTSDVWNQTQRKAQYSKLNQDISSDVVIVGAGIAGLLSALLLAKAGGLSRFSSQVAHATRWHAPHVAADGTEQMPKLTS